MKKFGVKTKTPAFSFFHFSSFQNKGLKLNSAANQDNGE